MTFIFLRFFLIFFCLRPLRKFFGKKVKKRMLSQEEYDEQGIVETEKALVELREYCRKKNYIWNNLKSFKGAKQSVMLGVNKGDGGSLLCIFSLFINNISYLCPRLGILITNSIPHAKLS